jgi:hypothetical protein
MTKIIKKEACCMKVANTKRIAEKIQEIENIRQYASMVNYLITSYINRSSIIPSNINSLRKEAKEMQAYFSQQGYNELSLDQIMLMLLIDSIIGTYLKNQPDVMDYFMDLIVNESKVFDVKEFNENPYIKNIKFSKQSKGDFILRYEKQMPYELSMYNIPKRIDQLHIDIPRVACFTEEFKYPAILQKSIKSTWMSVSPNEVCTMEEPINNAHGKVLTLGCGMGYFAYMASLKENVESITIIECEQSVIDLFETFILPQFKFKEKINIIKADAIDYLASVQDGEYDYCFADIWIGIEDIEPYFQIKQIGRKFKKTEIDYWIEYAFVIVLSEYIPMEIMEAFGVASGIQIPVDDESALNEQQIRIRKYIKNLLADVEITTPKKIDDILNPKTVLKMINETDIVF